MEVSGCGDGKSNGVDTLVQDVMGFSFQNKMIEAIFNNPKDDYNFYQINQRLPQQSEWGINTYVLHNNKVQFNLNVGIPWKVNTLGEKWKFNKNYIPSQAEEFTKRGFNSNQTAAYNELYQISKNTNNLIFHNDNVRNIDLLKILSSFLNIDKDKIYLCELERNLSDNAYMIEGRYRIDNWLFFVIKKVGGNKGCINYSQSDTNKFAILKDIPVDLNKRIDLKSYVIYYYNKYNFDVTKKSLYDWIKTNNDNKAEVLEKLSVNFYKINPQNVHDNLDKFKRNLWFSGLGFEYN